MIGGVTSLGRLPGLQGRVTLSAGITICYVNISRWGNPSSHGCVHDTYPSTSSPNFFHMLHSWSLQKFIRFWMCWSHAVLSEQLNGQWQRLCIINSGNNIESYSTETSQQKQLVKGKSMDHHFNCLFKWLHNKLEIIVRLNIFCKSGLFLRTCLGGLPHLPGVPHLQVKRP